MASQNMASQWWPAKYGQILPLAKCDRHICLTYFINCSSYGGQLFILIYSREPKDLSGPDLKFVTHFGCNKMAGQWWTSFTIGQIWPAKYDRHRSPTCILNCSSYGGQFLIIIDSREPKDLSGTDLKFVTHFGCNKMAGQLWTSFTFRQIWPAEYGQPSMASQIWPAKYGQANMASRIWQTPITYLYLELLIVWGPTFNHHR